MFQDIQPHQYSIEYHPAAPKADDYLLQVHEGRVLLAENGERPVLPRVGQLPAGEGPVQYLFTVDDTAVFLRFAGGEAPDGWSWQPESAFRSLQPEWLGFAGATAFHLAKWYDTHRFCGRCRAPMQHMEKERALRCPDCGDVEYPKIAPAVMVGITHGDKLLLTRYAAAAYRRHALVAGFVEIGETLEDAVHREVLEEVGLHVSNLRYYKSQPWAFSESLLVGFFADADSAAPLVLDTNELAEAAWFSRADIPAGEGTFSLTWDMIEAFRKGGV